MDNFSSRYSFDELTKLDKKFDQQLKDLNNYDSSKTSLYTLFLRFACYVLFTLIGIGLPFLLLVRTSVFVYSSYQVNGWLSIIIGIAATIILLLGYALVINIKYHQQWRINKYVQRGIIVVVVAYTLYGLLYYSALNTKTEDVKSYYRSLHPIMRVALSTITLADSDLVITDIRRSAEDYRQMGLPENRQSLHYLQSSGYVHAADLRTNGRSEWKNMLVHSGFRIIGLKTLRHKGTADHLHVFLPLND